MYAGLLIPFEGFQYKNKNKRTISAVYHILNESLAQSNDVVKFVQGTIKNVLKVDQLLKTFTNQKLDPRNLSDEDLISLGMTLREIGIFYNSSSLLHIALNYCAQNCTENLTHTSIDEDKLNCIIKYHLQLNKLINESKLRSVHLVKPLVDGSEI